MEVQIKMNLVQSEETLRPSTLVLGPQNVGKGKSREKRNRGENKTKKNTQRLKEKENRGKRPTLAVERKLD